MSTRSKTQPPDELSAGRRWLRRLVSAALLLHLAAVVAGPLNFATGYGIGSWLYRGLRPYIQAAYLDHGYFFFAPEPGPSHLVRYELSFDDGRPAEMRTFPDIKRHVPRLLYHRHFMLAEHLNALSPPPPPPDLTPQQRADWERGRQRYQQRWRDFQRHLQAKYGASVKLTRVEHRPAEIFEVTNGLALNAPQLYRDLPETPVDEELPGPIPMRRPPEPLQQPEPLGPPLEPIP